MIKPSIATAMAVAATAWISSGPTASGQDETDQRLGTVHFATSCNETAQRRFDRGHAIPAFVLVSRSPRRYSRRCSRPIRNAGSPIGASRSACSTTRTPRRRHPICRSVWPPCRRRRRSAPRPQRERDYHRCAARCSIPTTTRSPMAQRVQAYLKAMEALAQRYPDDDEAQIVYAITLNVAASPNDKTYANQLKGAAILEPIFKRQPRHPGVAHYLIHLYDYSGACGERDSTPPSAMPRSRRPRPTRSTCPPTSSRAWATGRSRSAPTPPRARSEGGQGIHTTSCMPWTTWSMPICSSGRTGSARCRRRDEDGHRRQSERARRPLRACRVAGALHGRTRRLEGRGGARRSGRRRFAQAEAITHFARALGRGAHRQSGGGQGRRREARRVARQAARGKGCLLVGAGRHPVAGRDCTGCSMPRASTTTRSRR